MRWMFDSVLTSSSPETAAALRMSTLGMIAGFPSTFGIIIALFVTARLGKKRSTVLGLIFATAGGLLALVNVHNFGFVCAGSFLKVLGAIPAQYVMVAMLSDVLDHLEARYGFRSDGFTMSIYGATMVVLTVLSMGIVNIFLGILGYDATLARQTASTETGLVIAFLGMDMIGFVFSILFLLKMDVEKYVEEDKTKILQRQKEAVLAEGGIWIEPEERVRLEQEEADRVAEEVRVGELEKLCRERGLDFEEENRKYFEKLEKKKNSLIGKLLGALIGV